MSTAERIEIEERIRNLSLADQLALLESLAREIRARTVDADALLEQQLDAMAADPDMRREIDQIQHEFAVTEQDGLRS